MNKEVIQGVIALLDRADEQVIGLTPKEANALLMCHCEDAIAALREAIGDVFVPNDPRAYSWKYDAYFNPVKNEWEERRCCDLKCEYCKDRPARPLDDESAHWDMLQRDE